MNLGPACDHLSASDAGEAYVLIAVIAYTRRSKSGADPSRGARPNLDARVALIVAAHDEQELLQWKHLNFSYNYTTFEVHPEKARYYRELAT